MRNKSKCISILVKVRPACKVIQPAIEAFPLQDTLKIKQLPLFYVLLNYP